MADVNIYDMADTWNDGATTFTAIKMNVLDTASNAASLLMDLQVGGASRFRVNKAGDVTAAQNITGLQFIQNLNRVSIGSAGITIASAQSFGWSSTDNSNATQDITLVRDAANTLAQRRSTNAQTHRVYGTFTDASNYRRVALAMTTAGVATLLPEGAGTGASGNVLHISGLPTSNPGPGILWNDGGTPAIGT
jgi:hypothetical protein